MNVPRLVTPVECRELLAKLFGMLAPTNQATLSIREDVCFSPDTFLKLGSISLHPSGVEKGDSVHDRNHFALEHGFYRVSLTPYDSLLSQLFGVLQLEDATKHASQRAKAEESLRSLASVCCRVGLLHPRFDADAVAQMPFSRPCTVVADTSSVIQGGLDFVVRFLYPRARVKIPAIVHMELINSSDSYMKHRRSGSKVKKGEALLEHAISQGGQRVLLRLELLTDTEMERTSIFSDPLRNAFVSDKSTDAKDLNLSAPVRGYCDRLILETARQHQSHTSPGHPVWLMTSDQGLARMALAEGMSALFFEVPKAEEVFTRILSGTCFHPFSGSLYGVSLVVWLWELAVTFGSARIANADGSHWIQLSAIGERFSWQPFHSKEDLLWMECTDMDVLNTPLPTALSLPIAQQGEDDVGEVAPKLVPKDKVDPKPTLKGAYKFSVESMLRLIGALQQNSRMTESRAAKVAEVSVNQFGDYKNFLLAGGLIEQSDNAITKTSALDDLWTAFRSVDLDAIAASFEAVPSFQRFSAFISERRPCLLTDLPTPDRARSTYLALAEIAGLAINVPEEGVYSCGKNSTVEAFADFAFAAYEQLRKGELYVPTGLWLEQLARANELHPVRSRQLLEEARLAGLIERFTEGATPDTRFEKHIIRTVDRTGASIGVRVVHLYHGDFLIPGKASVSLRLKKSAQ